MSHDPKQCRPFVAEGLSPLDASVVEGFRRAAHLNKQSFARIVGFEKPGHPGRAIMLLLLGKAAEGMTQREIADILHVSAPTVTVMLQKMESHGLVERWTDEHDQRVTRIRMTESGTAAAKRISKRYLKFVDASVGTMTEDDRREFARLLNLYADSMTAALERTDD